jgi:hypothetical protein
MRQRQRKRKSKKRAPKVSIALPFGKAVDGLLGLSPEDAKTVRETKPGKKKK